MRKIITAPTEILTRAHDFCKHIIVYSSGKTTRWKGTHAARRGRWEKYACAGIIIQMQLTRWLHASWLSSPCAPPPHSITRRRLCFIVFGQNIHANKTRVYRIFAWRLHTHVCVRVSIYIISLQRVCGWKLYSAKFTWRVYAHSWKQIELRACEGVENENERRAAKTA